MDIFEVITPKQIPEDGSVKCFPNFSNFSRLDNNETLVKLKNCIITQRLKLSNSGFSNKDGEEDIHSLKNYLMVMESYVDDLFGFAKCLKDEECNDFGIQDDTNKVEINLLRLGKSIELFTTSEYFVLWNLPITVCNLTNKTSPAGKREYGKKIFLWSLTDEIQISLISLSVLYFKNGLSMIKELGLYYMDDASVHDIKSMNNEEISKFIKEKNDKWILITENFFKKSVSICKYLKENAYLLDISSAATSIKSNAISADFDNYLSVDKRSTEQANLLALGSVEQFDIIELRIDFIEFLNSFTMANFQFLAVLLKNFWFERNQFFKKILLEGSYSNNGEGIENSSYYQLQDFNDEFYKENNYNLLVKIGKFILNELNSDCGILNYLTNFKNLVQTSDPGKYQVNKLLENVQRMIQLIKIFIIVIEVYLLRYLSLEFFIKKNQVGYSISLINYGFKILNESITDESKNGYEQIKLMERLKSGLNYDNSERKENKTSSRVTFKDKLKVKLKKGNSISKEEEYVTSLNKNKNKGSGFKFESMIKNGYYYRVILNKNNETKNLLILSDLNNLIIFMKNFKYKLTLENDNLSFQKIVEISQAEFLTKLPLGRQLPVNLPEYDPSKKLDSNNYERRDSQQRKSNVAYY